MSKSLAVPRTISDAPGERLIPFARVGDLGWLPLRRGGARLNFSTLYRWLFKGRHGIRLQATKAGSQWCTTETWLREFFAAIAAAEMNSPTPAPNSDLTRDAEMVLDGAGLRERRGGKGRGRAA